MTTAHTFSFSARLYSIGVLVFAVLIAIASRRRSDPARQGLIWLAMAAPLLLLGLGVGGACIYFANDKNPVPSSDLVLYRASGDGGALALFMQDCSDALFLQAIAEFGIGFLYVLDREKIPSPDIDENKIRGVAYGVGIALASLAISQFGFFVYSVHLLHDSHAGFAVDTAQAIARYNSNVAIVNKLCTTFDVLGLLSSTALLGFGGFIAYKFRKSALMRGTALYFLLVTVLFFTHFTWHIVYQAAWFLHSVMTLPDNFFWADPVLSDWTNIGVSLLLAFICVFRKSGLWVTFQTWMEPEVPVDGNIALFAVPIRYYPDVVSSRPEQYEISPTPEAPPHTTPEPPRTR